MFEAREKHSWCSIDNQPLETIGTQGGGGAALRVEGEDPLRHTAGSRSQVSGWASTNYICNDPASK